jgi:hypothetical protein
LSLISKIRQAKDNEILSKWLQEIFEQVQQQEKEEEEEKEILWRV